MIDWKKSAILNNCIVNKLKTYFVWFPKSRKRIIVKCDRCKKEREVCYGSYRALCQPCSCKGTKHSEESKENQRKAVTGKPQSDEHKKKTSKAMIGNQNALGSIQSEETREKKRQRANEPRDCICVKCGNKFIGNLNSRYCPDCHPNEYCYKWDEDCKEHNREMYNRECFFCGKTEEENGRKHDSHHVDNNKNQGCDETPDWLLVPLCKSCHGMTKGGFENRLMWESRILYLLKWMR